MLGMLAEAGAEVLPLVGYALGTVALTVLGAVAEYNSLQHLGHDTILTVWFAFLGAVALYIGLYLMGYQTLLARLRERRAVA